ncbi:MAG: hypothetical protein Q8J68_08880 [Methanolobus sp.]|nr:hypothetical protein [Methanolobus sp.]MDP2217386.1 hypothetical protein [Methanolobus sp.]
MRYLLSDLLALIVILLLCLLAFICDLLGPFIRFFLDRSEKCRFSDRCS